MLKVPDYREIQVPVSLKSLKNYIEPLLCTTGMVRDNEEILSVDFGPEVEVWDTLWITIKVKKHQEVEVFKH